MKKYEFKTLVCSRYNIEQCLNQYGELGYRSIRVDEDCGRYTVLLEREYNDFSVEDSTTPQYGLFGISKSQYLDNNEKERTF